MMKSKQKSSKIIFIFLLTAFTYFNSPLCGNSESISQIKNKEKASTKIVQSITFKEKIRKILKMSSGILEQEQQDLPAMIRSGKIRILTTYSYGNYFIHEGKTLGFEYNMMEEFKKFLAKKYRSKVPLQFYYIPVPYHLLIPSLKEGYGDIVAANLTILPERKREIEFSIPYLWNLKEVLVTSNQTTSLKAIKELSGRVIYIREDSSYFYSLKKLNRQLESENLSPVIVKTVPGFVNTGELIEMVSNGNIDMTFADSHIADIAGKLLPNIHVHQNIVLNDDVSFGWLVREKNSLLLKELNLFIKGVKKGTLKGNMFFNRYFKRNPWVRESLNREDLNSFSQYAPLFKKYGKRYNLDWMLLSAQAFQESGFNPKARSHMGAIGLMQLLPSTAKDMGIKNLDNPENNIHAGVKYMRWLIDNYFNGKGMSADDQMRFALAAYNAGPGNMIKSRKKTNQMGYDANRWFGNSELGTMKIVGLEPVHYVRNINRYYLSFLFSEALKEIKNAPPSVDRN